MRFLKGLSVVLVVGVLAACASVADAAKDRMTERIYDYTHDAEVPRGVENDSPTDLSSDDWGTGSWQGPSSSKSNYHVWYSDQMVDLFGPEHGLKVSDLDSISYWAKSNDAAEGAVDGDIENWWLTVYTRKEEDGYDSGWYDSRLHARPDAGATDYSEDDSDAYGQSAQANTWQKWSTDETESANAETNQLLFYDSGRDKSGDYTSLTNLADGNTQFTWDDEESGGPHDYSDEALKSITLQTDSGWDGFDGQVDGLTINLVDGTTKKVNFEPGAGVDASNTPADVNVSAEWAVDGDQSGVDGDMNGIGVHGSGGLPPGAIALDKGLEVTVSGDGVNADGTFGSGENDYYTLRMFYNEDTLADKGIAESDLRQWWWNADASEWVLGGTTTAGNKGESTFAGVGTSPGDYTLGYTGLNTSDNYTWVNANHASDYIQATPEPGSAVLMIIGLLGLTFAGGRRRRNR